MLRRQFVEAYDIASGRSGPTAENVTAIVARGYRHLQSGELAAASRAFELGVRSSETTDEHRLALLGRAEVCLRCAAWQKARLDCERACHGLTRTFALAVQDGEYVPRTNLFSPIDRHEIEIQALTIGMWTYLNEGKYDWALGCWLKSVFAAHEMNRAHHRSTDVR